eukprot:gb/GFBE01036960.1/.p1 GENE.gb/GFBE01036960.1/~~gb/GFBE01036960.1/.p1  ORF type:complete len:290 (+),score=69.22 gb/GFBE01036960.1/:1-870(+)
MAAAQVVTASELRTALQDAEAEYEQMQAELAQTQRELQEARRAGAAVLAAVEGAMAPLMAELAAARQNTDCQLSVSLGEASHLGKGAPGDALEAEIRHLKLDIEHYQSRAERLHAEERTRFHMLTSLRNDLQEASEDLSYENQRVRHHEVCRQLGLPDGAWVGLGPLGVGKRTLEARAEKKLRESAEERSARIARDVTKLAGDTAEHQATIEQLSRHLDRIRAMGRTKERRLASAAAQTSELHARLRGTAAGPKALASQDSSSYLSKASGRSRKLPASSSTGKLPQLSF